MLKSLVRLLALPVLVLVITGAASTAYAKKCDLCPDDGSGLPDDMEQFLAFVDWAEHQAGLLDGQGSGWETPSLLDATPRTFIIKLGQNFQRTFGTLSWTETINGTVAFHFRQTQLTSEYVQLWDASRQVSVRLYLDGRGVWVKDPTWTDYVYFYPGHFDHRDIWTYPSGSYRGAIFMDPLNRWVEVAPDGQGGSVQFYFREYDRDDTYVYLYDDSRHVAMAISWQQGFLAWNGGNWQTWRPGTWAPYNY
jgi:hypothetical protein